MIVLICCATHPFPSPFLSRAHGLDPSDDEMYQRTTVSVMKKEANGGLLIHSYSSVGFNIDGSRVFGPCVVLPPAILQWKVRVRFQLVFIKSAFLWFILTTMYLFLWFWISLSAGWKFKRHHRRKCFTLPYDWTKNRYEYDTNGDQCT